MKLPRFDIFCGSSFPIKVQRARWLGVASEIGEAVAVMNALANETPGLYFVYCHETQSVVASTDSNLWWTPLD
jgi:hypothetical protein